MRLFSAAICPYAQRTRAILHLLGQDYERVVVDLNDRPAELLRLSPTGKVPFLVDGELRLYESDIINGYLAEKLDWAGAYSTDVQLRARQRLAQKQWDTAILPVYYACLKNLPSYDEDARRALEQELGQVGETLAAMDWEVENMLGLHCAPFWVRMQWLREHLPVLDVFAANRQVVDWLERAVAQPAIVATNPDQQETVRAYMERFIAPGRDRT